MRRLTIIRLRLRSLFQRRRVDADLGDELHDHLTRQIEVYRAAGLSVADARDAALRQFGNAARIEEECRDTRRVNLIEDLFRDVRFAARQMKRTPIFTGVAILAIAIGIGANSTVFSFFNTLHLSALPVAGAERLVAVHRVNQLTAARVPLSADDYDFYRAHATTLSGVAVQAWKWAWLAHGEQSIEWQAGQVSFKYFDILGITPHVGAFFRDDRDLSSVVLSYRTWLRTFGGDANIVGRTVRIDQQPFTVAGVAAKDFGGMYLDNALDVWILHAQPEGIGAARLQPGRSLGEARAQLSILSARRAADTQDPHAHVIVEPLKGVHPDTRRSLASFPLLLAASTICLLAIACANLAGLLLARADARRQEIALRQSLGASRGRLVRQLLTESVLIAGIGGVAGLYLASLGNRALEQFFGYQIPGALQLGIDWRVVTLSVALSFVTGVVFGLAPAWHSTRRDLALAVRSRSYAGLSAVAVQIALSVVLLICAGLLFQSTRALLVRPGIDSENVAHFRLRPSRLGYTLERARSYQRELLRRVEAVPGVERAVVARVPPERGWCCEIAIAKPGEAPMQVPQNEISPGFLSALGIPLVEGRDFVESDRNVAIVNQTLAAKLWPKQSAIGADLWVAGEPYHIVGTTADTHATKFGESALPYLYLPMWGRHAIDPRLFVRVHGRAGPMMEQLRRAIVSVDPDVHVGQESTLAGRTEMSYQRERLLAAMLEFTGGVALLLSAIGIYGLISYQVTRRTREIAIRVALGAQRGQVIGWIIRRGLIAICIGLAAGVLAAWQAARMLSGFLYGIGPADALTFASAIGVLAIVALAASFLPARLVSRIDPAVALKDQ